MLTRQCLYRGEGKAAVSPIEENQASNVWWFDAPPGPKVTIHPEFVASVPSAERAAAGVVIGWLEHLLGQSPNDSQRCLFKSHREFFKCYSTPRIPRPGPCNKAQSEMSSALLRVAEFILALDGMDTVLHDCCKSKTLGVLDGTKHSRPVSCLDALKEYNQAPGHSLGLVKARIWLAFIVNESPMDNNNAQ